jgi:hypothetical protein
MACEPRTCVICRGTFEAQAGALYCSRRCRSRAYYQRRGEQIRARSRAWRWARQPPHAPAPQACAACGQVFMPQAARARYCSHACRQRAYRQRHAS